MTSDAGGEIDRRRPSRRGRRPAHRGAADQHGVEPAARCPTARRVTMVVCAARRQAARVVDDAGSPPCRAIIARNLVSAAPDASAARTCASASASTWRLPAKPAPCARQRSTISATDRPDRGRSAPRCTRAISSALPTARPSGASIRVMNASVRTPAGRADRHQRARQRPRVGRRLHERAAAALHVEHERVAALRELLAHHRRGDERQAFDRSR